LYNTPAAALAGWTLVYSSCYNPFLVTLAACACCTQAQPQQQQVVLPTQDRQNRR
jgi:hypothetical protein